MEKIQGLRRLTREIFGTKAFSKALTGKELMAGPDYKNDDDLLKFVRGRCDSYHHQVGSCKMGSDRMAVVDPQLKVHGLEGVRVVDASVMPQITIGNIHAPIMMIAEKASDMIKKNTACKRHCQLEQSEGDFRRFASAIDQVACDV